MVGLIRRFDMVGKEGRVHFRSRFVRTSAFRDEHAATTRLPTASRTLRTNTSAKRLLTRQTRARKTGPIPHPCSHAPVEGQADPRAQPRPVSRKLRRGAASCFPVLHRGIGTNVKIRKNVEEGRFGEFLFVQRNPSNTCVRPIGGDRLMSLYEGGNGRCFVWVFACVFARMSPPGTQTRTHARTHACMVTKTNTQGCRWC